MISPSYQLTIPPSSGFDVGEAKLKRPLTAAAAKRIKEGRRSKEGKESPLVIMLVLV